ncbi:hypothetical protein ACFDR9_001879 [Janthinobacterium sp. CG_23.3]|uniref:hypothetical protein n=1 Tax=unclassified Janthinobacterium TaxID=2610881 RepID=UPI0012FA546F|nr:MULTISPECIES: hypothetical protein [unclassified Janthinobacterium]MEC5162919.1 hypothetical protein [Janthinobacterium sp. CG_S6]
MLMVLPMRSPLVLTDAFGAAGSGGGGGFTCCVVSGALTGAIGTVLPLEITLTVMMPSVW